MQTKFNDRPATFDSIEKIESWIKAANAYYANHSEAIIICEAGRGTYALEDIKK